MGNRLSGSRLQRKIFSAKLNFETEKHFGELIGGYLIRRFRQHIRLPILDAGSADGAILRRLRTTFPDNQGDLVGLDLVGVAALNIVSGDLTRMPFRDQQFKTVLSTEVLEHLESTILEKTFAEFRRVLHRDGRLVCTFPYQEDLSKLMFTCPHCDESFHKYRHVRCWLSSEEVLNMFRNNGFEVSFLEVLPLGAVALVPPLRLMKFALNRLNNPPGLRKRAIVIARGR